MNVTIWLLAGAAAGWLACSVLRFNAKLGLPFSLAIGACGGVLGGAVLAPLLGEAAANPGHFNPLSVFAAAATGLACLVVSDMIRQRFGR